MLNSKRNAVRAERPTTVPAWLIALFAVLIGGALWMLYPKRDLERRLSDSRDDSELSLSYLTNLLKSEPDSEHLKNLLTAKQQRIDAQRKAEEQARAQAVPSAEERARAQAWEHWQSLYRDYEQAKALGGVAPPAEPVLQALAAVPRKGMGSAQSLFMASAALALGDKALALSIFEEVAQHQSAANLQAGIYAAAAGQALGLSMYEDAAALLRKASETADDPQQSRSYMWQALQVLQAGNRAAQALALAREQQPLLGNDPDTLRRLIALARAAGDRAEAERYAKQLLQLSLLQQWQQMQLADAGPDTGSDAAGIADDGAWALQPAVFQAQGWRMVRTADVAEPGRKPGPGLAFDDKTYLLGYEVFLENSNVEDAWRVASAAVRQSPRDMAWRERLAKVSQWSGRQQMALDSWLAIAQATGREDAWQAVMQLAPGLFDDRALIAGLRHQLERRPQDFALQQALVDAYERQANPGEAIAYLQAHGTTVQARILLAQLAERADRADIALDAWKLVLQDPAQRTPAHAMPAAVLALIRGEAALGLSWLEDAQSRIPPDMPDEGDYWRLLGDLALQQRNEALKLQAYRRLLQTPHADVRDYDELIQLLRRSDRREAAQMALQAWEQFHEIRHMSLALYLLQDLQDWVQLGLQFKRIEADPDLAGLLQREPTFFQVAGTYLQRTGQPGKAMQALERGLALDPGSVPMRQAMLWLLIDVQNASALKLLLATVEPAWAQDAAMHTALGAAYMALSRPAVALQRYLQPQRAEHEGDFLWLMLYADALEQNQQSDLAWRLRRQVWSREMARVREAQGTAPLAAHPWLTDEGLDEVQRQARNRLMLFQSKGEEELALLRELMRLDRQGGRRMHSDAAAELAIAWLQERGEYSAERGFLWQQYARGRAKPGNRPLWAEITVALAGKDVAEAGQLLERFDEALPRYDRVNAAALTGDVRLAQTAAFETQQDQPDDDPLHLALTEQLLAFSDTGGLQLRSLRMDSIVEQQQRLNWHLALDPRWSLDIAAEQLERHAQEGAPVRVLPTERGVSLRLTRKLPSSTTEFMLGRRESLGSYTPVQLSHSYQVDNRLSLQLSLGRDLPTQDTLELRMGGMKDRLAVGATYRLSRLDQVSLELAAERYRVQTGESLGSGRHAMLQYLHTYRSEAPLVQWGGFTSWHGYSQRDASPREGGDAGAPREPSPGEAQAVDYRLPRSFRYSGLQLLLNMGYAQQYSRALRPFARLALTHHSINGVGYDLGLGLATSVLGPDHLALGLGWSRSGLGITGNTRELQINYRLHY